MRAYTAPGQGRYWVMARRDGRDRWFQVSLPRAAGPMLRTAAQDGELVGDMRVGSNLLQFEIQRLMGGDDYSFRMRTPDDEVFNGSGTRSGPEDDDTPTGGGGGGTQALGFFGALVAIVAIICATVTAGMAMGYEADFSIETRGGFDITFDVTQVPNEPDGDGFQHDPSCDLMPPINC